VDGAFFLFTAFLFTAFLLTTIPVTAFGTALGGTCVQVGKAAGHRCRVVIGEP
jgi:hypothetical protein